VKQLDNKRSTEILYLLRYKVSRLWRVACVLYYSY